MTNHITLSDFPASCSCMKLTSKQGRPYWFRTCDLNTSIWDAGAHAVSFPADYAITTANGTLRTRYALLGSPIARWTAGCWTASTARAL